MNLDKYNKDYKKYSGIIKKTPNNYEARILIGMACINNNNISESKLHFEKAIAIDQTRYEAYVNLSNVHILLNNISDGINILKKFVHENKYNKHIITNLALIYFKNNKYKDLEQLLSKCLNKEKNHVLLYLKAKLLLKNNTTQEAIDFLLKSINTKRNFWPAYEVLFSTLETSNQLNNLKKYISEAKVNFLNEIKLIYYESLYLYRIKEYNFSLKTILKNDLEKKFNNGLYLVNVLDLLSKNYDKLKKFENSYNYALKRNKIFFELEENKKYDKKIILETIQTYKNFFKKSNLTKLTKVSGSIPHDNLVFLIGFPRSGTTLLDSILRTHSKTLVLEEKPYLLNIRHNFFTKNDNRIEALNSISVDEKIQMQKKYFNQIDDTKIYKDRIIIDKFPLNIVEIGFIKTIFPNSKTVLALRHPCDAVLSSFLTLFKMNDAMANFLDIKSSIYFYNEVFDLFEHYEKLYNLRCYNIKYEDIVINFNKTIQSLLEHLGLKYEKNIEKFYETAKKRKKINTPSYYQVSQPLYIESINRWKNYQPAKLIYPMLKKWITKYEYL